MSKYTLYSKSIDRRIILIAAYVIVSGIIVAGCLGLIHEDRISKKYQPTSAKIEEIRVEQSKSRSSKDIKNDYHVTVSYQVSGTAYRASLGHYNSSWKTGDTIIINYNPENPGKITFIDGNKLIYKLLIGVGLVTLVLLWGTTKLINKMVGGNFWKQKSY